MRSHSCRRFVVGRLLLAGGVLISVAAPATGQVVRGSVRSRATNAEIPGAVLVLIDSAGAAAARTLADEHGDYALYAPAPGQYRLRASRIGVRPLTSDLFGLAGDTTMALQMIELPLDLPAVTTRERTQCSIRPDSGFALATLWEDAKTALLATAITREGVRYRFDLVDHTRVYDFATRELLDVALTESSLYATRSWASVAPDRLRRDGYVFESRDSTAFVAPDIETLLSDYFVSTHCFRVGEPFGSGDSLVAVVFDPAERTKHVEVRGTLWIDRRTHELRSLDFHYVNLSLPMSGADSAAGGHVGFARLSTGGWVMTDWTIRVPVAHVASEEGPLADFRRAGGPIVLIHRHPVVDELRVSGGTLRAVFRDDSLVWSRGTKSVQVRIASGDSRASVPARRAAVFLVGSGRPFALADTNGIVTIDELLPGPYLIEVATRDLDVLGWARARARIDVDTITRPTADVRIESPLDAARAVCLGDAKSLNAETGVIVGSVSRDNEPVSGRAVTVSWVGDAVGAHSPGSIVTRTVRTLASDGRFIACGVPRNRRIEIRVAGDDAAPLATQLAVDQVVGIVAVALKREP
ncbi:MAG TPA: carboxypeptidase-like regulatory domain-containing protein [Gemmatimonadaceae bacterium]